MHRIAPRLAVVLVLSGVAASCPAEEPVDARTFVRSIFDAGVVCFPTFLAEAEPIFLEAQALSQIDSAVVTFERQRNDPNVQFSRAAYDLCLEVAAARDCERLSGDDSPCASVFVGLLSDGDECAENVQCGGGLSCFQEPDACGVCSPIATVGESCAASNCADGAFCDDATSLCRTQPDSFTFAVDAVCDSVQGCGGLSAGLACAVEPNQSEGVCVPIAIVDEGEACEIGIGANLYCRNSSSTHLCESSVCTKRPALGSPCSPVGACDATAAACVEGECVNDGDPGDACDNGFGCQLDSICQQNVCRALNDNPQPPRCE